MLPCRKRSSLEEEVPERIAGIDVPFGLELLSGNQPLYLDMLRKFLAGHRDAAVAIRRALAANEWEIAKLIAHNTKGVCACIGATALQGRAATLEWAIETQSFELDTLLHQFETTLNEVMTDLEAKLLPMQPLQSAAG